MQTTQVSLPRDLFIIKKTSVALLGREVEDLIDLGTTMSKKSYHRLGLSPMRPNELWTCRDDGAARAQAPGCQRSSCGSVRRGGTGIVSDVVKVEGDDPATPG